MLLNNTTDQTIGENWLERKVFFWQISVLVFLDAVVVYKTQTVTKMEILHTKRAADAYIYIKRCSRATALMRDLLHHKGANSFQLDLKKTVLPPFLHFLAVFWGLKPQNSVSFLQHIRKTTRIALTFATTSKKEALVAQMFTAGVSMSKCFGDPLGLISLPHETFSLHVIYPVT